MKKDRLRKQYFLGTKQLFRINCEQKIAKFSVFFWSLISSERVYSELCQISKIELFAKLINKLFDRVLKKLSGMICNCL